jgi:hypothetical protein
LNDRVYTAFTVTTVENKDLERIWKQGVVWLKELRNARKIRSEYKFGASASHSRSTKQLDCGVQHPG